MPSVGRASWQLYEKQIETLLASLGDGKVTHNVTMTGQFSTRQRQIDVLAQGTLVGRPMTVVVECKDYKKKRIGIDIVESFIGKLLDIGVGRGVMYAYAGFTKDAYLRVAKAYNPEVSLEEFSSPGVGLVPLGGPEMYEYRTDVINREDSDERISYSIPRASVRVNDEERDWVPRRDYSAEDYRDFLLTGIFPSRRPEIESTNHRRSIC
ncbi:restriction endonuclease [Streptosporangium roseum]|uniref:restriction endonuclease n=1 Tax=Streptosporangium roseum TaxID=2001 RepID=UPI003326958F